ncbi:hypothetical protein N7465_008593 [Penicillium sp. CMV-2018d]|nr:hypothetical protein N7465_008593 [Penicillium sp. CMV-2018d]
MSAYLGFRFPPRFLLDFLDAVFDPFILPGVGYQPFWISPKAISIPPTSDAYTVGMSSSPIWHALSTLNVSATVAAPDAPSVSTSVSEYAGGFSVLSPRRTLSSPLQGLRDTLLIVQTMVPG